MSDDVRIYDHHDIDGTHWLTASIATGPKTVLYRTAVLPPDAFPEYRDALARLLELAVQADATTTSDPSG